MRSRRAFLGFLCEKYQAARGPWRFHGGLWMGEWAPRFSSAYMHRGLQKLLLVYYSTNKHRDRLNSKNE